MVTLIRRVIEACDNGMDYSFGYKLEKDNFIVSNQNSKEAILFAECFKFRYEQQQLFHEHDASL